jgi:hypothetical protein
MVAAYDGCQIAYSAMPLPDPAVRKDSKLKYDRDGKQPEANILFS